MNTLDLRKIWKAEEDQAHIHGWDFSHINDRYEEEGDLPWDYGKIVRSYLDDEKELLDMDTGGGEFLLSLGHPYVHTAATEGYPPNVDLCRERLEPLGIRIREIEDHTRIPFGDGEFDLVINRHGDYCPRELWRVLKEGGFFITEQVGEDNDRDLVELLLPGTPKPFPGWNLKIQSGTLRSAGFELMRTEECFRSIRFYDVGALVWFARIIQWEFPGFSVEGCFDRLLEAQQILKRQGVVEGRIHRFLMVARKGKAVDKRGKTYYNTPYSDEEAK